jgi:uncharacterized protein (DUF433 family)
MTLPDFLIRMPEGEIRLMGHRIGLFHLIHYYNEGYSPEMLVCQYPTLPLALIHKAIAFYLENSAEVDAEVAATRDELSRQLAASPRRIDVPALRRRLETMRQAEGA